MLGAIQRAQSSETLVNTFVLSHRIQCELAWQSHMMTVARRSWFRHSSGSDIICCTAPLKQVVRLHCVRLSTVTLSLLTQAAVIATLIPDVLQACYLALNVL